MDGFSDTRESIYPKYITGDARIEGFCTFFELKSRIEKLERMVEQLSSQLNSEK
jgi:hypothetical protein